MADTVDVSVALDVGVYDCDAFNVFVGDAVTESVAVVDVEGDTVAELLAVTDSVAVTLAEPVADALGVGVSEGLASAYT